MEFGIARAGALVNVYNLAVDDQTTVREITDWTIEAMGIDRSLDRRRVRRMARAVGAATWRR